MGSYDRAAWDACMKTAYEARERRLVPARVRAVAGKVGDSVSSTYQKLPIHDQANWVLEKAFDGALAVTFRPALRTVKPESVVRRVAKRHPSVQVLSDIRSLNLEQCDHLRKSGLGLTVASAAEGAASSLAVTGAEVATTVSAGTTAGVAIGAIAADTAATMAAMGRSIGVVASAYGYDVRQPEEELFALGVMSLASASTVGGKTTAMASLSKLTQQMMRQATWSQLQQNLLVNAIDQVYKSLGFKLTKKKLGQAVPVAGAVLNASVNAGLVHQTFRRAEAVYRLRFLSEKYGIDPAEWRRDAPTDLDASEDVVQVDEALEWQEKKVHHSMPPGGAFPSVEVAADPEI
ncbi:hypothetical protein ASD81_04300 [Nocardioides sp. Root614]|nr:hypothetical protein ASD81_04300 [Nocardioides sp. Root614]KRA91872.1 hypothetical protein ASD84_04565 [Nocardioides sp. Root682]